MGGFDHTVDGGRNSVISRVHRLGLPARESGNTRLDPAERERRVKERERVKAVKRAEERAARAVVAKEERIRRPTAPIAVPPPYLPAGISFGELRDFKRSEPNQCRYIDVKDMGPNFLYCGSETLPGESYCGHCRDICTPKITAPRNVTQDRREQLSEIGRAAGYASIKRRGRVMGRAVAVATSPVLDIEARV